MLIPLEAISQWPAPNRVNPETHSPAMIVIVVFLMVCVTILLGIRLYTRQVISKGSGLDDILILLAYVPSIAFAILGIYGVFKLDWDRHAWDANPELTIPSLKMSLVVQVVFDVATSLTKLSMLALIYRVVTAGLSSMRYFVIIFAGVIAVNCLLFVFITIFQCSPVSDAWTPSFTPQKCLDQGTHLVAASIINTVTDFIIVLLPIKTVLGLRLPRRQRVIVYLLFSGGLVASISGAIRTYYSWLFVSIPNRDTTWIAYYVMLTSTIELFVGIICASIPATKPFFSRYVPRLIGLATGSHVTEPLGTKGGKGVSRGDSTATLRPADAVWVPLEKYPAQSDTERRHTAPDLNKPLPSISTRADRALSWAV